MRTGRVRCDVSGGFLLLLVPLAAGRSQAVTAEKSRSDPGYRAGPPRRGPAFRMTAEKLTALSRRAVSAAK